VSGEIMYILSYKLVEEANSVIKDKKWDNG
jgi:hypothetical protein